MAGLGVAQLVAWGSQYYAIAVLGQPMRRALALTDPELFGAFACSLALSGLLAPWAGRLVDRIGGRSVLACSSLVGASGFVLLATTSSYVGFAMAWAVLGVSMALGLYDTCFAALAQAAPLCYRRNVTGVTLIAGLASSAAWPASHCLLGHTDWRGACWVYAAALLACLPVYLLVLPAVHTRAQGPERRSEARAAPSDSVRSAPRILALAFAGGAFIAGAFSAQLIQTLCALHISPERAVWLASTVGAMQVAGRLVESLAGRSHTPLRLGFVTFALLATSTIALLSAASAAWLALPAVLLYGIANGLTTVAKAAIPVELFGFENVGASISTFSSPSLLTRAAAPFGFALLTDAAGVLGALVVLVLIAAASFAAYAYAMRLHYHRCS